LIDYSMEDLRVRLKEMVGDKGLDVIYDPVGGKLSEAAFRSIGWKGRYLVVGFTSGEIQQLPANLPLLKGASIMGVFWGSFAEREPQQNMHNIQQLTHWIQHGKITQHIHQVYSLEDAPKALLDLIDRKVIGKAVIKI
ncbi:MAG: zinc-binding dehydrogenase, partial [Flammeovirgaceae bacterium]